eukprot:TRINITY_DN1324_c0_g2_i1.p1 TRINITY_DN1324_c0_g2~~TRINITY_DN1324_c0_g2_i1.p1  ORF type:complete len:1106 (-),score=263.21 TRINITY_DN1324_c0_g2_i1:129-3446(-)
MADCGVELDAGAALLTRGFGSFPVGIEHEEKENAQGRRRRRSSVSPPAASEKRSRKEQDDWKEAQPFWTDVRGRPEVKDGHGLVKPEAFLPDTALPRHSLAVIGLDRRPKHLRVSACRGQRARRPQEQAPEATSPCSPETQVAAAPSSPPGRRYFRGFSKAASAAARADCAAAFAAEACEPEAEGLVVVPAREADGESFLPLASLETLKQANSAAVRRAARQEALHLRCRSCPTDIEAWIAFAEFQWPALGRGVGATPGQVREKQRAILDAALRELPGSPPLLRATARAEMLGGGADDDATLDAVALHAARRERLLACGHAEAAEELVWAYMEAAILAPDGIGGAGGENSGSSPGGSVRQAAEEALGILAARKVAAGHDGRAVLALERAELAAISAVALADVAAGRFGHAVALLRANATLGLLFPDAPPTDAAFAEAWAQDCRLGGQACSLQMLRSMQVMRAAWSGVAGPCGDLPQALLKLEGALDAALRPGAAGEQTATAAGAAAAAVGAAMDPSRLLEAEGGPLRGWAAKELGSCRGLMSTATSEEPPLESLRPLLVSFRTEVARREALMRLLDFLGAPTLVRAGVSPRYRAAFQEVFASLSLRGRPWTLSRGILGALAAAQASRGSTALLARAALQALALSPGDVVLLEALMEALWRCAGADVSASAAAKLPRRVLQASEDPRLFYAYARGLWMRGQHDAARGVLTKLCSATTPPDARIAFSWWHLELQRGGHPQHASRILVAMALGDFSEVSNAASADAADVAGGLAALQAASRLRLSLAARSRGDAGGCRLLTSSYCAALVAACALDVPRSPERALRSILREWATALQAADGGGAPCGLGASSSAAAAEEHRCWALAVSMFMELLVRLATCPGEDSTPAIPLGLVRRALQASLERLPGSPWLLRALVAVHLHGGTVVAMRRDLDRALGVHAPPPLLQEAPRCSSAALRVALEAELAIAAQAGEGAAVAAAERLVALCDRGRAAVGSCPFASASVWSIHQLAILIRAAMRTSAGHPARSTSDCEERWRAAVRAVRRHPRSKALRILHLAAWEARLRGGQPDEVAPGPQAISGEDEEELVDMLEASEAHGIVFDYDPLEAIA